MRYPWLPVCLAFITGILLSPLDPAQNENLRIGIALTALAAVGAALWERRLISLLFVLCAFALTGAALHTVTMSTEDSSHLSCLRERGELLLGEPLELIGIIERHPERRSYGLELEVSVEKLSQQRRWRQASGMVRIRVYLTPVWEERDQPFRTGDRIRLLTRLEEPRTPGNPGDFDHALYLRRRGITHKGSVKSPLAVEIIGRGYGLPGVAQVSSLRSALSGEVREYFSPAGVLSQRGALLEAMLLGRRGMISEETKVQLRRAGLLHIIAISGYHVWLLSLICFLLLRAARLPDRWASIVTIVALASYWALAGGRSSASRACLVGIVYLLGRVFYRKPNTTNSLAFAALLILVFNPAELYSIGFQLTFAAAFSIALLYRPLKMLLEPLGWVGSILAVSFAVQLGILPLTAVYFNIITLHSALTTTLLIPTISLTILLGFLFLLVVAISPLLGGVLAGFVSFLLGVSLEAVTLFDQVLPLAIRFPAPPSWLLIVYIAALMLWLVMSRLTERKLLPALSFAVVLLLVILNPFVGPPTGHYRLHMIDVGQAESMLLELPDGSAALIDGGGTPTSDFDIGENVVSSFLWARGHRQIDLMVSTHSDTDHIEGLIPIASNFGVRELWVTSAAEKNENLKKLMRLARRKGIKVKHLSRGQSQAWRTTRWTCLNPPRKPYVGPSSSNNNSLVTLVEFGRHKVLLTGDAEAKVLKEIAASYSKRLDCDVLKIPHHGGDDALDEEFLDFANPRLALISAGYNNPHDFPQVAVLDALDTRGIRSFRTDRDGAVTLTFGKDRIEENRYRRSTESTKGANTSTLDEKHHDEHD